MNIAYFYIRRCYRRHMGLCSNALIYKTILILQFLPLSLSRLIRYIALLFCFYMKFSDVAYSKNAFYEREAHFEIKNEEYVTISIPFEKHDDLFIIMNTPKSLKNHSDFAQQLLWEMLCEIASSQFEHPYA